MSKKQIFLVFACDEWCSKKSQTLLLCTTSVRRLKTFICREIQKGNFEYNSSVTSRLTQIEEFKHDFDECPRDVINSKLKYGYFDYCYDGEEL